MKRFKYLIKNILIFALGNVGSKLIAFLLVPLYTAVLTVEEYGTVDLLFTICTIIGPILTCNIGEGILRYLFDKDANKGRIMRSCLIVVLVGFVVSVLIVPVSYLFTSIRDLSVLLYVFTTSWVLSQIMLYYLRGMEMPLRYSIGSIFQTLSIAGLNIIFLKILHWGVNGYFMAYCIANTATVVYAFIVGDCKAIFAEKSIDVNELKSILKYSIAFMPNTFMWWIMNASDRVMVTAIVGAAANGIYAVSYKIPGLISICNTIFCQAWTYSAIKEANSDDRDRYYTKALNWVIQLSAGIVITVLCVLKPIMRIYVSETYFIAWKYSPILLLGNYFLIIGSFVASSTYNTFKDSKGMLKSGILGAIPNIILNFCLIPMVGVYGAAVATCISYYIVFLYRLVDSKRYISLHINGKSKLVTILVIFSVVCIYLEKTLILFGILLCYLLVVLKSMKEVFTSVVGRNSVHD